MHAVIEIENLTKDYQVGFWRKRPVRALDGLSLTVNRGETFGFLGPNGAGKTTTMKILMRLTFPTSGTARIMNHDIADVAMHRRIGYLPEHPYFYDYLTAREFLEYCAELFGYDGGERRSRAERLLTEVRLEEKSWDKQLRRFSKGMLQRVGLAQALINDPEIAFLDEPMSGLDPVGRREVRDLITGLRTKGTTVFLCSHILSDIEVLCDRALIMKGGRINHIGTVEELRRRGANGRMEITIATNGASSVTDAFNHLQGTHTVATPGGARIEVADESLVDEVLATARRCGAKLVSVQPMGSALEELFNG